MKSPAARLTVHRSRRSLVGAAIIAALLLAALLHSALTSPATSEPQPEGTIQASFFGTHQWGLDRPGGRGWPEAPVGSIRLWDNGVAWNDIEKSDGVFDWARLDALVALAHRHGATVLYVLGQTPRFHSSQPDAPSYWGPGASALPADRQAWTRYVQAVAWRREHVWGGKDVELQVWNEANVASYWSGTSAQMAELTRWTWEALHAVGSTAPLIAPAFAIRTASQRGLIDSFYAQSPHGANVSRYVDALSFQLYPSPAGGPEESSELLHQVRRILANHRVSKPIYASEINYGLVGGTNPETSAQPTSTDQQVGNVARTFILNAQDDVRRVYWYSWDLMNRSNTPMVQADLATPTAAGRAFGVVQSWLLGTRPAGCTQDKSGTYTCKFLAGDASVRQIIWNPRHNVTVPAPLGATSSDTMAGIRHPCRAGTPIEVGVVPLMVHTSGR